MKNLLLVLLITVGAISFSQNIKALLIIENNKIINNKDSNSTLSFLIDNNGENELFGPVFENVDDFKYFLFVYDTYGKQLFKSNFENQAWNEKVLNSNSIAPYGAYIWKLEILDAFGNKEIQKGQVTLLK